ncbi:hypothetical protein V6N12_051236 [Hibiscus sabdariffa]|uniref:Uncharacterized protein n=1 Tax=Hibiscus sabdariffa TaxID=183260 RepID=A0ABR2GER9_9ROSI
MTKNRQVNVYLEEEVTEVVRTETGDATRDVTEEAIVDVPGCATGDATEEACGDATSDLHEEATADVTGDAIEEASGDATGDDVTGEADDVEVDDSCSEKDSDYVVDDLKMMTMVQKIVVKRLTTSPSKTSPFVFIPTPGLASHPTTQQSCPTQQPGSVMTVRLMPTSQEHCSVDQSLSQSSTLTQNVQENKSNEGLGKGQRWCR